MRLTPNEVEAIKDCARVHFGEGAVVRLFGSRVRDDLRGGDIDLHIIAEAENLATRDRERRFKERLEQRIGEQRIDVIVKVSGADVTPFERLALAASVIL